MNLICDDWKQVLFNDDEIVSFSLFGGSQLNYAQIFNPRVLKVTVENGLFTFQPFLLLSFVPLNGVSIQLLESCLRPLGERFSVIEHT